METVKVNSNMLTAVYMPCDEGGYTAFIEEIPGVNSQGETLEEAKENLKEALDLTLEVRRELAEKELQDKNVERDYIRLSYEIDRIGITLA